MGSHLPRNYWSEKTGQVRGSITLRACEDVPIQFTVSGRSVASWMDGVLGVVQFGKPARLSLDGVALKGSALIEQLIDQGGRKGAHLVIEPIGRPAVVKIRPTDSSISGEQLDDVHGQLFIGDSGARFEGLACGGTIKVDISLPLSDAGPPRRFNVTPNFEPWGGRDVRELPYFEKACAFWNVLALDCGATVHIEFDGRPLVTGTIDCARHNKMLERPQRNLQYIRDAAVIASRLDVPILVNLEAQMSYEGVREVSMAAAMFEERRSVEAVQVARLPSVRVPAHDAIRLVDGGELHRVRVRQQWSSFTVFGRAIELPLVELRLNGVALAVAERESQALHEFVELQYVPGAAFRGEYRFVEEGDDGDSNG